MNNHAEWKLVNQYAAYTEFSVKFTEFVTENIQDIKAQHALCLAVEELATNTIKYNSADNILIIISITVSEEKILLIINDNGQGFDPAGVEEIDFSQPIDDIQIGGLGLNLVKKSFDSFEYCWKNGQNSFIMTYKL